MDLLSVFRTFRRQWKAALPLLVITALALAYVVVIRPADYETTANVVLISPPSPPVGADGKQILLTPAGKTDNPLARFPDQSVVVNIVSRTLSTDATRKKLAAAGADPRYELNPGSNSPVGEIVAIGSSAQQAERSASLVAEAFVQNLAAIQTAQGVDPAYFITTLPVEAPEDAKPKLSSTLRLAVAVLGLGLLATFFTVSLAEARSESRRRADDVGAGPDGPQDRIDGRDADRATPTQSPTIPAGPTWRAG